MGKMTSKCCLPCEAKNEMGNANLDQTRNDIKNDPNTNYNRGFSSSGDEKMTYSKTRTILEKENLNSFIKVHNRKFLFKILI